MWNLVSRELEIKKAAQQTHIRADIYERFKDSSDDDGGLFEIEAGASLLFATTHIITARAYGGKQRLKSTRQLIEVELLLLL